MEDPGVGLPFTLSHKKEDGVCLVILGKQFFVHSFDGENYAVSGSAADFDYIKNILDRFQKGRKRYG